MMAKSQAHELAAVKAELEALKAAQGDTRPSGAPDQTYPTIEPAPLASSEGWTQDDRGTSAPEQSYPVIEPAPPVVEAKTLEERVQALEDQAAKKK